MPLEQRDRLTGGRLHAAIANAVVQVHRESAGRGPTKAQAFSRGNVVVLVMGDTMTRSERALFADGKRDAILLARDQLQSTMRNQLVNSVEELTGCRVVAFMSDNDLTADLIAELFVLDRPLPAPADA
jgi:uncharacterized protein YbcI